jgi:hypothetical protein
MSEIEKAFYLEVKEAIERFAEHSINEIKGIESIEHSSVKSEILRIRELKLSETDLKSFRMVIQDSIIGAVHSIFVSIDGGTAISSNGRALQLVDAKTGVPITSGALHENFMDVLD